jgi:lysozyme
MDREKLIELIKREEGFRDRLYKCSAGKWTIGFGYNIEDRGLPKDICEELLRRDIEELSEWAAQQFPWWHRIGEARQMALLSMAYQLGRAKLLAFKKMLKAIGEADWERAYREALDSRWARQTPQRAERTAKMLLKGKEGYDDNYNG